MSVHKLIVRKNDANEYTIYKVSASFEAYIDAQVQPGDILLESDGSKFEHEKYHFDPATQTIVPI